jgi:integrase
MGAAAVSALAVSAVEYDPLRDKSYQLTRLGRSVADFLAWIELGGAAETTVLSYEWSLQKLALMFPDKALEDVTDGDLVHVFKRFPARSRRSRVAAYSAFFRWAKQNRRIADNPMDYVPTFRRLPRRHVDVFTEAEIEALTSLPIRDGALMQIMLDAGLRKAEARSLQLRHYKPDATITAPHGKLIVLLGKGSKDRVIPATLAVAQKVSELAIQDGLGPTDFLWYDNPGASRRPRRVKPIQDTTFARWWAKCLKAAGVDNPHAARHTFATRWRNRGLSADDLQILLGHASVQTTADLYVHTNIEDVARRMALIQAAESTSESAC